MWSYRHIIAFCVFMLFALASLALGVWTFVHSFGAPECN